MLGHLLLHLGRVRPVVGRARVLLLLGADVGAGLDARDVGRVGAGQEGVRSLLFVELDERALVHQLLRQAIPLFLGAVGEDDLIRSGELDDLGDPAKQLGVLGRGLTLQTRDGRCGHLYS